MSIFWSMGTAGRVASASADAAGAANQARTAQNDVQELEVRLERALMACEAMWSLMRDKMGVTDEELANRINDIDLSDGKLDGKVRKTPVSCPNCKRTISRRFATCMYCGQPIVHDPFA